MRERKAFTLIELLIVVAIIGILTVVVVSSYGTVRQKAKMDLIADTLISSIKTQYDSAKSGKGESTCYGIYFNGVGESGSAAGSGWAQVQIVKAPYVAVSTEGDMADYCDIFKNKSEDFAQLENFKILDVNALGVGGSGGAGDDVGAGGVGGAGGDAGGVGAAQSNYLLMFKPPRGNIVVGTDLVGIPAALSTIGNNFPNPLIVIKIGSPTGEEERSISFNVATGVAQRVVESD
jgi:prepilin-type N-terminal cleavage/methylation domain-containing protein